MEKKLAKSDSNNDLKMALYKREKTTGWDEGINEDGPPKKKEFRIRANDFVAQQSGRLKENYRIGKCLGSGAFGEVRICVHKTNGNQRAVKILKKSSMDEDEKKMLFNEINNLKD